MIHEPYTRYVVTKDIVNNNAYIFITSLVVTDQRGPAKGTAGIRATASVCRLYGCVSAKRCVLEQKLDYKLCLFDLESRIIYEKSIGTKMNDLDLCLEVV